MNFGVGGNQGSQRKLTQRARSCQLQTGAGLRPSERIAATPARCQVKHSQWRTCSITKWSNKRSWMRFFWPVRLRFGFQFMMFTLRQQGEGDKVSSPWIFSPGGGVSMWARRQPPFNSENLACSHWRDSKFSLITQVKYTLCVCSQRLCITSSSPQRWQEWCKDV